METDTKIKPAVRNINKPAYAVFLLAGIYFMLQRNFTQAATFWGLALMFDPFNVKITYKERPVYQQLWLLVHLSITLALFVLMIVWK